MEYILWMKDKLARKFLFPEKVTEDRNVHYVEEVGHFWKGTLVLSLFDENIVPYSSFVLGGVYLSGISEICILNTPRAKLNHVLVSTETLA